MDDIKYWSNEFEKTKRFLELCSPEVHDHVREQLDLYLKNHPSFTPTSEQQGLWDRFIISNPILQRVIYYTYSPVDAIELRYDEMRSATDLVRDGWYIDFALRDTDFPNDALLRDFLDKMKFDMDPVSAADNWKREGAEESIEELRTRFYGKTWEDDDGCRITKLIIDQSFPGGYRDEIIAKRHPDGTITEKYHTHILGPDEPDTSGFIDETLIRWMQLFEDDEELRESAFYSDDHVYVHNSSGKVIEEIPFGMANKYKPLIKATPRKYPLEREAGRLEADDDSVRDKMRLHWDLEQILREAILSWDRKTPPPAYFQNALRWGFLNLEESFKKRLITKKDRQIECKKCGVSFKLSESKGEECPSCEKPIDPQDLVEAKEIKTFVRKVDLDFEGGSLDEPVEDEDGVTVRKGDLLQGKAGVSPMAFESILKIFSTELDHSDIKMELEDRVLGSEVSRLIDLLDHPVDKALLIDFYDSCCCDRKPISNVKMSRLLEERGETKMTPQGIGKRREKLLSALRRMLSK